MPRFTPFERRMAPFIALQAAVSALSGFAGVFIQSRHGAAGVVRYAALMLGVAALGIVLSYAGGRWRRIEAAALVRMGFAVPLLLLPFAERDPAVLALAFGGFLGLTWGARHWLELHGLADAERDGYAAHATALAVAVALLVGVCVSLLLTLGNEARAPVYAWFMALAALGALVVPQRLPAAPPVRLSAPVAVLRQPGFLTCLPLFFLESGLLGIGLVLNASGAVNALGQASHYGWAASAATVAGAMALYAARGARHSANRDGWMRAACIGVVGAAALLGASAWWPALFVLHLLLQSAVQPFWAASEHVLNQRALDLHGAIGDRIVVREGALGLMRLLALGGFWAAAAGLDDHQRLVLGAGLMAAAALLEYLVGRAWLGTRAAGSVRA